MAEWGATGPRGGMLLTPAQRRPGFGRGWGWPDRPESGGFPTPRPAGFQAAPHPSTPAPVTFSELFLQCLWKCNLAREMHV